MENKEIFKVGDTVYHFDHGKGRVVSVHKNNNFPVRVDFDRAVRSFTRDGRQMVDYPPTLSFTPYDLVNGGLSQERPLPDIEVDTLVYVRDGEDWNMRYFSHFGEDGKIYCFGNQQKSTETDFSIYWSEWSLTNPLEEQ